jgi:hypothetical protein
MEERLGSSSWRVLGPAGDGFDVQHADGRVDHLSIADLLHDAPGAPAAYDLLGTCFATGRVDATDVAQAGAKLLRPSVLRPRHSSLIEPCVVPVSDADHHLVLHRRTAFGEGTYLLSLVSVAEQRPRWTVALDPWLDDDSDDVQVLDPQLHASGELRLWLLRQSASLVTLAIDAQKGDVLRSTVVF